MKFADTLSTKLWKLAQLIIELVEKTKGEGGITRTSSVYVKPQYTVFEFKDGSIGRQSWTYKYTSKEDWNWRDVLKFIDNAKKLPQFAELTKLISATYDVSESQAEFWLSGFAQFISRMSLEGMGQEGLVHLVTVFVSDLEGNPKNWTLTAWLNGVWTKETEIRVSEGLTIRHPKASDFEVERPLETIVHAYEAEMVFPLRRPSAVMELSRRSKGQPELSHELDLLLTALRLFRVGSVAVLRVHWSCESIIQLSGFVTGASRIHLPGDKYPISGSDVDALKAFLDRIKPLIPREVVEGGEKTDYVINSIQRYNDAMLKAEPAESRMTLAMTSLEGLHLKSGEGGELEQRLSQRVAKLLSIVGQDPMEAYNTMRRSYDVRSKFVHGEPLEKADKEHAAENLQKVLDYNRMSIVLSLQLREKMTKEQLVNLIDNSLLSPAADKKLNERVKEICAVK